MGVKSFAGLGQFGQFMEWQSKTIEPALASATFGVVVNIHNAARKVFGDESKIAPLAPSTKDDRVKRGFADGPPLIRRETQTGPLSKSTQSQLDAFPVPLRDTLEIAQRGMVSGVGSEDERLLWHHLGSGRMPPRPVLAIAVNETRRENFARVLAAIEAALSGTPFRTSAALSSARVLNRAATKAVEANVKEFRSL